MRRHARGAPHCGFLTPSGLGAALLALLAFGCSRLEPGELGEASVVVARWTAVGEARVERTYAEYQLRATCMNAGGPVSGVAALVVSTSPATTILENQIRCGPIDERSTAPTLDTITIRQDRTLPFSPRSLTGVALVWGPETQESETRTDRVYFDYGYYAYLENGLAAPVDVVATVVSTSSATVILDDTVAESALESRKRRGSTDRFSFRHDRGVAFDPTALVWTLDFGGAQRPGFVAGEVYDDATGRTLAGVAVQVQGGGTTTTDGQGGYQLPGSGLAIVGFTRDGYTPAWREVLVPGGGVATPLDVRLRPRARPIALTVRDGGTIPNNTATLDVPVASLRGDATVSLTELGAQALPAPLPLGWAPVAAFEIDTGGVALGAPLALVLPNTTPDPERDVAVRFDAETRRWLRIEMENGAGARIPIASTGAVALARRDLVPASPPLPEIDSALEGVAAVPIPAASSAELLPSPRVLFASNDARADVRAVLRAATPLPSGTPLRVDFAERYLRLDAATVEPPPMAQDLLLYPGAEGPEAAFVATPSPAIEPASLREGTIDLAANVRDAVTGAAVLDGAGGTLTNGALALTVPPGALAAPIVASLAPFVPLDPALVGDARFSVLAGARVDLGGASLSAPAQLTLPLPAGTDVGDDLLVVVAPRTVLGATRWELVGLARVDGDTLVVESSTDPPLPGIGTGDRYAVVRLLVPAGFVAGTVQDASGAPAADALVSADTLPFIGRTEPGDPRYAVVAAVGDAQIDGLELTRGDEASVADQVAAPGAMTELDLALGESGPRLVGSTPPDGAIDIGAVASLRASFSRPLDAASVDASAISLLRGDTPVEASLALSADGRSVSVVPAGGLADDSDYVLAIRPALRDPFGNAFRGDESDGSARIAFRTADVTPPPRPEAGQISAEYETFDHLVVQGTQGAAEPGSVVVATNQQTGLSVSVLAAADGSFSLAIDAAATAPVVLAYRDSAGNQTDVPFDRPVVVTELRAEPATALFLELGAERPIAVTARFSDGSERALSIDELEVVNSAPAVASVSADGRLRSVADGVAALLLRFGAAPYRAEATVTVRVMTQGEEIARVAAGPDGVEFEGEDGFALRIPAGALASEAEIVVERFPLPEPLEVEIGGATRSVLALYRFTPDLDFTSPVMIELPLDFALSADETVLVRSGRDASLGDLEADDFPNDRDEFGHQFLDPLNGVVRVLVSHLSYRTIERIGPEFVAGSVGNQFLEQDGVRVDIRTLDGTGSGGDKPSVDRFVVWHATNEGVNVNVRLVFDAAWVGRRLRFSVPAGVATFISPTNNAVQLGTSIDRTVRIEDGVPSIGFGIQTLQQSVELTIQRTVAVPGGGNEVRSHTLPITLEEAVAQLPAVSLTEAATNSVIAAEMTLLTPSNYQSSQNKIVEDSLAKGVAAHYYVNSRGVIYQLYTPTERIGHAGHPTNDHSTGIEIQHSIALEELYAGPQLDSVLALTDFLINRPGQETLLGLRGKRRRPDQLATTYPLLTRTEGSLGTSEPVLTHKEQDFEFNSDDYQDPPHACGTDRRKADPCGPFELEGLTAALAYDFPGLIDTSGGDMPVADLDHPAPRGGDVMLAYGERSGLNGLVLFRGIPGGDEDQAVDMLRVEEDETVTLGSSSPFLQQHLANLVVHGTLILTNDTEFRVSGVAYVAPGGRILSQRTNNAGEAEADGINLTIRAAGPVIVQGLVDLSGRDDLGGEPGRGGNFAMLSRGLSPLLVPSIVTRGGDVLAFDESQDPLVGKGGRGGDVTIVGPPRGLIVFSGMKQVLAAPVPCDVDLSAIDAGLRFPFARLWRFATQASDAARWSSSFESTNTCARVSDFNPQRGLARTLGRGIVTSGGTGGSARVNRGGFAPRVDGAPGGDGGRIRVSFPNGQPGALRFRGVTFLTGGGAGTLRAEIPIVPEQFGTAQTSPLVLPTGGAGGRGSPGGLRAVEVEQGNLIYFAPLGGDGGDGGAAGDVFVDPAAQVVPAPESACTKVVSITGNDGDVPIRDIGKPFGQIQTLCGGGIDLLTLYLATVEDSVDDDICEAATAGQCALRVLAGSGGLPGGSVLNRRDTVAEFEAEGTAGHFGRRGPGGSFTLPGTLDAAVRR